MPAYKVKQGYTVIAERYTPGMEHIIKDGSPYLRNEYCDVPISPNSYIVDCPLFLFPICIPAEEFNNFFEKFL